MLPPIERVLQAARRVQRIGRAAMLALVSGASAEAADILPLKGPQLDDWTGIYFGGHVGYSRGIARVTLADPDPTAFTQTFGSLTGGLQLGVNYLLPSRFLLGLEADVSFPNYLAADDVAWFRTTAADDVAEKIDYMASVRGRFGYAFNHWLLYATAGLAWSQGRFLQTPGVINDTDKVLHLHAGWAAGAGAEVQIAPRWTARLEYLYRSFGRADIVFPSGAGAGSSYDVHTLRLGLNYRIAGGEQRGTRVTPANDAAPSQFANWEVHGQSTYIQQGYPAFRAPYSGANSLSPAPQSRETWSTSAFFGLKLWEGGELYYNPELLQGFGLSDTFGAGGFPNGEAQKSNFAYPHYSTSRLYLRQTFGLGGGEEKVESAYGQMAGTRDVSRITVQAGRFAVHDLFDNNAYAYDSRADFMNWSLWAAGAFDYSADKIGLSYGAVAELNQKDWAVRTGYFLMPNEPNANNFDPQLFARGAYVAELESRYALFSRPGKLRLGLWANSYFAGSYRAALDLVAANPGLDPTDAIIATRRGRSKYGYYINAEQSLTDDLGMFARWSWNDGRNEIAVFTDIDWSLSGGASIAGNAWGRPADRLGVAVAINGLSAEHRDYLAAGGLGILIGDGALNYRPERVIETYYALKLIESATLTFDYQLLVNPAHNADRGPVSIFTARMRGEF